MLGVCEQFLGVFQGDGQLFKILIITQILSSSSNIYMSVEEPVNETQNAWPLGGEVGVRSREVER